MKLPKELKQRLAEDYRFAVTKMQQEKMPAKKLFYYSIFFSEAQRALNWAWDRDLALVQVVTQQSHTQINAAFQAGLLGGALPIDPATVIEQLTKVASELTTYFEKAEAENSREELYEILGRLAEVSYVSGGNGSYLYDKGDIKF
jgi:hypothetical protein